MSIIIAFSSMSRRPVFTPARVRCKVRQLSRSIDQTIRLSPHDPNMGNIYWRIGLAHLLQSRTDDAILWIEKARTANPALSFVHAWLASAYALKGKTERAAAELAKARSLRGQGSSCEHRSHSGHRTLGGTEDPRLARNHVFRRPAQGGEE
jgi:tetratricopeptide (TPR) repeat protein